MVSGIRSIKDINENSVLVDVVTDPRTYNRSDIGELERSLELFYSSRGVVFNKKPEEMKNDHSFTGIAYQYAIGGPKGTPFGYVNIVPAKPSGAGYENTTYRGRIRASANNMRFWKSFFVNFNGFDKEKRERHKEAYMRFLNANYS